MKNNILFFLLAIFGLIIFIFILATAPAEKKLWGAYNDPANGSFTDFENMIGAPADMQAVFVGWNDPFPAFQPGKTLVIFWEQYNVTLDDIISGKSDDYIQQFASAAKSYGGPVILAPLHEMNGNWSPWSGVSGNNTPQKVISAWIRIKNGFSDIKNIKWAWVVNNESVPDTPQNQIENYYPGDGYVDYAGVDGFNFGNPWQSYDEIFSKALSKLKKYNKPIFIFSMASASGPKKADWIKDALYKIKADKIISGFIWFNMNKEKNWLINSDPASLDAFRNGIK